MTEQNKNEPLDIWGDPIGEKRECFHCASAYYANDSDAPVDYQTTYCSLHCYEQDHLEMKMAASAAERVGNAISKDSEADSESEAYTTTKIGDFVLKVRKADTGGDTR